MKVCMAGICAYFGLKGIGPASITTGAIWVQKHKDRWGQWVEENGPKKRALEATIWDFMSGVMRSITFDRQYDLSACREIGFHDTIPTVQGYTVAFDKMRAAKIIPSDKSSCLQSNVVLYVPTVPSTFNCSNELRYRSKIAECGKVGWIFAIDEKPTIILSLYKSSFAHFLAQTIIGRRPIPRQSS